MTHDDDGKAVYRRLRIGKRKGQFGSPRLPETKSLNLRKLIDDFFAAETVVTINNEKRRMTNYEAILNQLWAKAVPLQNLRANRVFLKYTTHGASRGGQEFEIQFAPKPESTPERSMMSASRSHRWNPVSNLVTRNTSSVRKKAKARRRNSTGFPCNHR